MMRNTALSLNQLQLSKYTWQEQGKIETLKDLQALQMDR